jgi:hypothetical protein
MLECGHGQSTALQLPVERLDEQALNVPQTIPTTGAENLVLYAVVATGIATISVIYPG